jgi:hypothetical protein
VVCHATPTVAVPAPPTPPAFAPGPPLARATRLWRANALAFTLIAAALDLPTAILQLRAREDLAGESVALLFAFQFALSALAEAALVFGALRGLDGRRVGPLAMLAGGSERFLRVLAVNAVCLLLVAGGLLLLVVPGILVLPVAFVAVPAALSEPQLSIEGVLRRSWSVVRPRLVPLVLLSVGLLSANLAVAYGIAMGLEALQAPQWLSLAAQLLGESLVFGLVTAVAVVTYRALSAASPSEPKGRWAP